MISRRKFLTASVLGIGAVAATGVVGASQTDPLAKTFDLFQASYPVGGFPDNENYGQHGVIGFVGVWLEKDSNPEQRLNWMTLFLSVFRRITPKGTTFTSNTKSAWSMPPFVRLMLIGIKPSTTSHGMPSAAFQKPPTFICGLELVTFATRNRQLLASGKTSGAF